MSNKNKVSRSDERPIECIEQRDDGVRVYAVPPGVGVILIRPDYTGGIALPRYVEGTETLEQTDQRRHVERIIQHFVTMLQVPEIGEAIDQILEKASDVQSDPIVNTIDRGGKA